jgi:hypothetical protein
VARRALAGKIAEEDVAGLALGVRAASELLRDTTPPDPRRPLAVNIVLTGHPAPEPPRALLPGVVIHLDGHE